MSNITQYLNNQKLDLARQNNFIDTTIIQNEINNNLLNYILCLKDDVEKLTQNVTDLEQLINKNNLSIIELKRINHETKNNINKFCNSSLEQLVIQSDKQHSIVANNLVEFCKHQLNKK